MNTVIETISPGDELIVRDVVGAEHRARAASAIETGGAFPRVWVKFPDSDETVPWPTSAIRKP